MAPRAPAREARHLRHAQPDCRKEDCAGADSERFHRRGGCEGIEEDSTGWRREARDAGGTGGGEAEVGGNRGARGAGSGRSFEGDWQMTRWPKGSFFERIDI